MEKTSAMIPYRIKEELLKDSRIANALSVKNHHADFSTFKRTAFNWIARTINIHVSQKVIEESEILDEFLLFGEDEFERLKFKLKIESLDEFVFKLSNQRSHRLYTWISGKTLESYWHDGNAKDKKLNVLLYYLDIPLYEWDNWKNTGNNLSFTKLSSDYNIVGKQKSDNLLKKYYLGQYYLYYQKTDGSPNIIKAPFVIKVDSNGQVIAETETEKHRYRSKSITIREGCLYISCINLDWDEKENHIFNIGSETNPEVLFGVSNTVSVKKKHAIGIKNVLVKQPENHGFYNGEKEKEKEIPMSAESLKNKEESIILKYFRQYSDNLIITQFCCTLDELSKENDHKDQIKNSEVASVSPK